MSSMLGSAKWPEVEHLTDGVPPANLLRCLQQSWGASSEVGMKLDEYTGYDGLGLAALVRSGQVSPSELADTAQSAIDAVNPTLNAVIGRIEPRAPARIAARRFSACPS
jgi:hypothetical protein